MNAKSGRLIGSLISLVVIVCLMVASTSTAFAGGKVIVLPVQVCNNAGADCANAGQELFETATDKIWAQADIDIEFLAWDTWNSTANQTIVNGPPTSPAAFFAAAPDHALKATHPNSITMWFIKSMNDGTFGEVDAIGGNKAIIMDNVFATARRDTIAHELGHNLGLRHQPPGDPGGNPGMDATYLMWSGGRTIPGGLGDINPDGLKLDKLTDAQKVTAMASPFVVPEPGSLVFLATSLGFVLIRVRRRSPRA